MVVLPKDDPLFINLNAYYLDIAKLIEHLQGEIGCGSVFFKAYSAEGALFFDKDNIINGILQTGSELFSGKSAIERLTVASNQFNFNVCVYRIGPEAVYFWAGLPGAEKIYQDLSTEFTDLDGLINKMSSERLTGYIDVQFDGENGQGMIFLINGEIVGAASSWSASKTCVSVENKKDIVQRTQTDAAIFNVCRIPMTNPEFDKEKSTGRATETAEILNVLEEFLATFEKTINLKRRTRIDFHKMLKHKFVENAEKYTFLDPFAAEFEYENKKITFTGHASDQELSRGVIFSVLELADELGLRRQFSNQLTDWSERHGGKMIQLDILI